MMNFLAIGCGALVGFTLGLIGGGGSILATPLLLYVVGVAAFGVLGAFGGSTLGKAFDGQRLLFLFAIIMVIVGILMLGSGRKAGVGVAPLPQRAPAFTWKLAFVALAVGLLSGFFGIGGGFLIVPGLLFATGMPLINAVGTSLFAVGAFGLATATNYAASGLVDWKIAGEFIVGGFVGHDSRISDRHSQKCAQHAFRLHHLRRCSLHVLSDDWLVGLGRREEQ
jgi:uncharacterized membrane protein YfcA